MVEDDIYLSIKHIEVLGNIFEAVENVAKALSSLNEKSETCSEE